MKKLKVSVAMITYNGAGFIEKQLVSILNQTVKPDEIIISDDGSTDGTLEIILEYIDKGVATNFENAFRNSTADFLFFSCYILKR